MNTPSHLVLLRCSIWTVFFLVWPSLHAFTVTKDVNRPPIESLVLFAKGGPSNHLMFAGSPDTPVSVAGDGSLEILIKGPVALDARIAWSPGGDRPESFKVTDHAYLMLTCRVEGSDVQKLSSGKTVERRADNLWLPVNFYDAQGNNIGGVNLASVVPGEVTPAETTVLRIPMFMFTFWGDQTQPRPPVAAIGFAWGKPRAPTERNYRIVIDHIALAD